METASNGLIAASGGGGRDKTVSTDSGEGYKNLQDCLDDINRVKISALAFALSLPRATYFPNKQLAADCAECISVQMLPKRFP